jgi:hypothetical protein
MAGGPAARCWPMETGDGVASLQGFAASMLPDTTDGGLDAAGSDGVDACSNDVALNELERDAMVAALFLDSFSDDERLWPGVVT